MAILASRRSAAPFSWLLSLVCLGGSVLAQAPEKTYLTRVELEKHGLFTKTSALAEQDLAEDGHRLKLFLIPMEMGKTYDFDMESDAFDAYLRLLSPGGQPLVGAGERIARLQFKARENGLHRLQATSARPGEKGAFTLKIRQVREGEGPPDKAIEIAPAEIKTGAPFYPFKQKFTSGAMAYTFLVQDKDGLGNPSYKARYVDGLVWSKGLETFFVLEAGGILRCISLESWTEERRLDLKERCGNLAMSKEGLLVSVPDKQQVWVVDPEKLVVTKRIDVPAVLRVVSAPNLSYAVAASHVEAWKERLAESLADDKGDLIVLDLVKGEAGKRFEKQPCRFLVMAGTGKALFAQNAKGGISAFRCEVLDKDGLGNPSYKIEAASANEEIGKDFPGLYVSRDGRLVAMPGAGGNRQKDFKPREEMLAPIFIYDMSGPELAKPAHILSSGKETRALGFGTLADEIFVANERKHLVMMNLQGGMGHQLFLGVENANNEPREFLPHPHGEQVLVRFDNRLVLVKLTSSATPLGKADDRVPTVVEADKALRFVFGEQPSMTHQQEIDPDEKLPGMKHPSRSFFVYLKQDWKTRIVLQGKFRFKYELFDPQGNVVDSLDHKESRENFDLYRSPLPKESGFYKVRITKLDGRSRDTSNMCGVTVTFETGAPLFARDPVPLPIAEVFEAALPARELKLPEKITVKLFPLAKEENARPAIVEGVHWSADGKALLAADAQGTVYRIDPDKGQFERRLEIKKSILGLGMSSLGLVVGFEKSLWIVDPDTLDVKNQIEVNGVRRLFAAPGSHHVVLDATQDGQLPPFVDKGKIHVLDLSTGKAVPHGRIFGSAPQHMAYSPDGKYLFWESWKRGLSRMQMIDGKLERTQESIYQLAANPRKICVSPDGKYVCFTSSDGNSEPPVERPTTPTKKGKKPTAPLPKTEPYTTFIFQTDQELSLKVKPAAKIVTGPTPNLVSFDAPWNCVLAHNQANQLLLVGWDGAIKHQVKFKDGDKNLILPEYEPREFAVHPAGGQVVIRWSDRLALVNYSALPKIKTEKPDPDAKPIVSFALDPVKRAGVVYRELDLPKRGSFAFPVWDEDGKYIYHFEYPDILHRTRVKDFISEASKEVGKSLSDLAWSKEGLLLVHTTPPELHVIDPKTLAVKANHAVPASGKIAVAPDVSRAVVVGTYEGIALIDLKKQEVIARDVKNKPEKIRGFGSASFPPALTPDGKYLFVRSMGEQHRYRIDGKEITFNDKMSLPGKISYGFSVSPDGKYLGCYYPYEYQPKSKLSRAPLTEFFSTSDWKNVVWAPESQHHTLAFDRQGRLYTQDLKNKLTLTTKPMEGGRQTIDLDWPYQKLRAIVPSPNGDAFLAIAAVEKNTGFRVYLGQIVGK